MPKVCEICGRKDETDQQEEKEYDILSLCESCLADRSTKQTE